MLPQHNTVNHFVVQVMGSSHFSFVFTLKVRKIRDLIGYSQLLSKRKWKIGWLHLDLQL